MPHYKSLKFLGYPKYRVGDDGSIWSYRSHDLKGIGRRWRWRRIRPGNSGRYCMVRLCHEGKIRSFSVHVLVLLAFVGPRPKGYDARHYPNQDSTDNRLCNLSWSSKKVNQRDRLENGTDCRGEKHKNSSLTDEKVRKIRKLRRRSSTIWTLKRLAERFKVSISTIHTVVHGVRWSHVSD